MSGSKNSRARPGYIGHQAKGRRSSDQGKNASDQQNSGKDPTLSFDPFKTLYSYEAQRESKNVPVQKQKNKSSSNQIPRSSSNYKSDTKYHSVQDVGYFGSCNNKAKYIDPDKQYFKFLDDSVNVPCGSEKNSSSSSRLPSSKKSSSSAMASKTTHSKFNMGKMEKALPRYSVAQWLKCSEHNSVEKDFATRPSPKQSAAVNDVHSMCAIECCINLTWSRRLCNGSCFVTYADLCDFMNVRENMTNPLTILGNVVSVQISKTGKYQFYVTGIPPSARVEDVEESFRKMLSDVKPERIELKFEPAFETSEDELCRIRAQIMENCRKFTNLTEFEVDAPKPKPTATIMKAYINVSNDKNLDLAAMRLSDTSILREKCRDTKDSYTNIRARPVYRLLTSCGLDVCKALDSRFRLEFAELESEFQGKFRNTSDIFSVDIKATDDNTARIKLLTNHREILNRLQDIINRLLEGEILNENNTEHLRDIFLNDNLSSFVVDLGRKEDVYVLTDCNKKHIRLFGLPKNCLRVKKRIEIFLKEKMARRQ